MNADDLSLTDVGPATSPPSWCLPDAAPEWLHLTEQPGGGTVCSWERRVSDDVLIVAEDRVVDGRVMRSAPRIIYFEPPRGGITCVQARELAEGLVAAADVITCSWLDEAVG